MTRTSTRGGNELRRQIRNLAAADSSCKETFSTVFGETPTVTKHPTTLVNVVYGKATAKLIETVDNGGTITDEDSMLVATSSTAIDGLARVESEHAVRYTPGEEFYCYFTSLYTAGVAGATQLIGPFSDTDGFAIGFNGADFGILHRSGSVDTFITQADWNRDILDGHGKSGYLLDTSKLVQFRITFGWLGSSNIFFQIYTATQGWIFFHEIEVAGTLIVPHILVPYLPICLEVKKTSGETNIIAKTGSWNGGIMGRTVTGVSDLLHAESVPEQTISAGVETHLISLRGLATLNGIVNRIEAIILHWSVAADGTKPALFRMYKNSTLTGGVWSNHETDVSIMEINTTATVSVNGEEVLPTSTARQGSKDLDIEHLRIDIHKNDSITITAISTNNSDVLTGIAWREDF